MRRHILLFAVSACLSTPIFINTTRAADSPSTAPSTRPVPRELSEQSHKALAWLVSHQLPGGAWGQGDEASGMGNSQAGLTASANVADTCMASMALYRAGNTPSAGRYKDAVYNAVNFVCDQVEKSDADSLFITELRGTRTQSKLGTYIDTFLAAQMLSEVKSHMPTDGASKRVNDALTKVVKKIEKNQQDNGQWANQGWAPTLAQAAAAKCLNAAAMNGVVVNEGVRAKAEEYARADFKNGSAGGMGVGGGGTVSVSGGRLSSGAFSLETAAAGSAPVAGDAGVKLYSSGSQIAAMQASKSYNDSLRQSLNTVVNSSTTQPQAREQAQLTLKRFDDNDKDLADAQKQVVANLEDKGFIAGFGSNGGEEFLSHLNIGESLFAKGGADWQNWETKLTANMVKVQNDDGSWSGSHCITGRTFCTSAALMVLTIDRTPGAMPIDAKADAR